MLLWPIRAIGSGVCEKERDQQVEGGDPPLLLCLSEATLRTVCVQFWAPQFKKGRNLLEGAQWRATKMIEGLEHLPHEEGQSNLGVSSLRKRQLRGDLINIYNYLKGGERQKNEARLFLVVHSNRTRSNSLELKYRKFHSNMQKNFLQ